MIVSPFQLLKRNCADALAARAVAALAQWSTAWAALPDHAVSCAAASDRAASLPGAPELCRRVLDGGSVAWAAVPGGMERYLEQLVFGLREMDGSGDKHLASRLGTGVAEEALEDLLNTLLGAVTGKPSEAASYAAPAAQLMRPGSGAVVCTVLFGERTIRLLLPPDVLPAQALKPHPQAPALSPLHQALAQLPVPLSVEVCNTEMTLGYLRTLAVGDVLALPMTVDQELRVTGPGGTTVCHAHLGAMAGSYAVELIKAPR